MGANAQTSVPAFTAGQVLTAQQQTEINTGIPVFATTTTRDAAFGGTGEKTLAEGQFAYIEATNTTQYYDGSTWQTVGASGLTFITSSSFTNAATVTIDNCFTSTYKRYLAVTQIVAGVGGAAQALQLQFRYGSTTQAASYYSAANIAAFGGSSGVTAISNGSVVRIQSNMGYTQQRFEFGFVGNASERAIVTWQSWGADQGESFQGSGYVNATQTYTGFILSNSLGSANMTGTVWVYGLAAS
jgi:hypothetical protein